MRRRYILTIKKARIIFSDNSTSLELAKQNLIFNSKNYKIMGVCCCNEKSGGYDISHGTLEQDIGKYISICFATDEI